MPEATFSRHAPLVAGLAAATVGLITAGLVRARTKEKASRWALLNEAVGILRKAERRAGEALTALTLGEPPPHADWKQAVLADGEELRGFLRRSLVEPEVARWVEDAIGHLAAVALIPTEDADVENDLTDWLVRLSAAREQLARFKRAARVRSG